MPRTCCTRSSASASRRATAPPAHSPPPTPRPPLARLGDARTPALLLLLALLGVLRVLCVLRQRAVQVLVVRRGPAADGQLRPAQLGVAHRLVTGTLAVVLVDAHSARHSE